MTFQVNANNYLDTQQSLCVLKILFAPSASVFLNNLALYLKDLQSHASFNKFNIF